MKYIAVTYIKSRLYMYAVHVVIQYCSNVNDIYHYHERIHPGIVRKGTMPVIIHILCN